jgi:hypothetical protein
MIDLQNLGIGVKKPWRILAPLSPSLPGNTRLVIWFPYRYGY